MQGQKGVMGSLPETFALEQGSSSSDPSAVEQQICWTNFMRHPPAANLNQERQNLSMWSMGESSSSSSVPSHVSQNGWSSLMKACSEPQQNEPIASMLSLGDNANNSTHVAPHNVTVNPSTLIGMKPTNYTSSSSSSDPLEMVNRQLPRKRKAADLSIGQSSSGIESSSIFHRPSSSTSSALRFVSENPPSTNLMPSDPTIPRLGLGIGGVSSETTRRNVRIRINNSRHQQDPSPAINVGNTQLNFSSPYPPLGLIPELRPPTVGSSLSQEGQPMLRVPPLRRNLQLTSRSRSSTLRANRLYDGGLGDNSGTLPINISDHPLFMQPRDIRSSVPQPATTNWSFNGNTVPAPTSSVPPNMTAHRGSAHHPSRRLSEILRRSLLSSTGSVAGGGITDGGQSSNLFATLPPPVGTTSQGAGVPPVIGIPGHHHHHRYHLPHQRMSDRQLDAALGFPLVARAPGSEGRGRLVSEIRSVLDLIRRGEGLRFEDVMILDQSVLYGMADMHDRHRDMRLDIDNMSYEELLALEERIGNVNTGLTEENVSSCLKQKTYTSFASQPDAIPCCICQEEYKNGDDLGSLKCGHEFHTSCIKHWLLQKNLCPVCKSEASK